LDDWLLAGDFNMIRSLENRNRAGGNLNDMQLFNDLIQQLDLAEISFQGRLFPGVICREFPFWRSRTGFSPLLPGLFHTQILQFRC
jgi:hypothetical protein